MKRVYVAGKYSDGNAIDVLNNIGRGIEYAVLVAKKGYAPFCPWLDCQFVINQGGDNLLPLEWFYKYSLSWLSVSDAILVIPGYEDSKGTLAEIELARQLNIPIFYSLEDLTANLPVAGA